MSIVLTCDHCNAPIKIGQMYHEVHYTETRSHPPVVYHYHHEGMHIQLSDIIPDFIGATALILLKEHGTTTMKSYDPQHIQTRT